MVVKKSGFPDQFFRFMNLFHQGCRQATEYVGCGFGHLGAKKEKTAAVLGLGSGGIRCSPPQDWNNRGWEGRMVEVEISVGQKRRQVGRRFCFLGDCQPNVMWKGELANC